MLKFDYYRCRIYQCGKNINKSQWDKSMSYWESIRGLFTTVIKVYRDIFHDPELRAILIAQEAVRRCSTKVSFGTAVLR